MTDVVFLPLFSISRGVKTVPERSGLNQWNASGRTRQFGEAYVSIPSRIREVYPDFFPDRGVEFELILPSGRAIRVKRCQQDGKALMSSPNSELCTWLFFQIDGSIDKAMSRFVKKEPYTYDQLLAIEADSLKITRDKSEDHKYLLSLGGIGKYESQFN